MSINETPETLQKNNDDNQQVEYVKEKNPLIKFLKIAAGVVVVFVVGLFIAGFLIGLSGYRPPTLDTENLIKKVLEETQGSNNTETDDAKEQVKVSPSNSSTSTPTPIPTSDDTVVVPSNPDEAYKAGREAGRLYKKFKDNPSLFWQGFNYGAK